ncbi:hypothetical protein [Streptomyces sp. NPDC001315]|uniref:hypothetical protein n=1 Tax=Streptomyces sp. NPDC001315 TaxID=3364562 RepID=UPI0036BD724E
MAAVRPDDAEVEEVLRPAEGRGADVVLGTVGGRSFPRSVREVGHGGRGVAPAAVALVARAAHEQSESRDHRGKIVLAVVPE